MELAGAPVFGEGDRAVLLLAQIEVDVVHLLLDDVECDHVPLLRAHEDQVGGLEPYLRDGRVEELDRLDLVQVDAVEDDELPRLEANQQVAIVVGPEVNARDFVVNAQDLDHIGSLLLQVDLSHEGPPLLHVLALPHHYHLLQHIDLLLVYFFYLPVAPGEPRELNLLYVVQLQIVLKQDFT